MPFLTPENILQDKDNTLNKKEKSQLQSFAKQLNQIWDKVKIYLNKNLNSQEKKNWMPDSEKKIWPLPQLKSQVSQSNWESYKQRTIESIKTQFNLEEIAKNPAKRTPENVAMLQLFLFLKGAYQPDANGKVSEKKIDGKWGEETAEALRNFKNNNPQFAQELAAIQEQKNQIEAPYIAAVLDSAKVQIGKPYRRWGSSERWGFDCSWVWIYAFKKQGINFNYRPTAKTFFDSNKKINKEEVKAGDFMFWKSKPWANKHSDIYHIEMTLWEPYQENGKWYVKTIGSAKNRDAMDEYGNRTWKAGVWYRIREITPYRKFWRPSYYYQLAENAKKSENTIAKINSERNKNETVS